MTERLPISTEHCIVERDGHVVIVTMNRPEARNALSSSMLVGLADAWAYISDTPEVRVAVLTGAEGTFCAGADLKAMGQQPSDPRVQERMAQIPDFHWKGLLREGQPTKPLICAIEGYAVARGLRAPSVMARRAWFRLTMQRRCPVVYAIGHGRVITEPRDAWLGEVAKTHELYRAGA